MREIPILDRGLNVYSYKWNSFGRLYAEMDDLNFPTFIGKPSFDIGA